MYAYPQRPGAAPAPPSTAFSRPPPVQQPAGAYVPPPPPVAAPGVGLYSASSGSVTTLRLRYSDDIRLDPRVPLSATLLQSVGPQAPVSVDLSLERSLAEEGRGQGQGEGGGSGAGAAADVQTYLAGVKPGELPRDPALQQLLATGAPPAAAALGAVYGRAGRGGTDKAADFASKLEQLSTMGFPLALAAGALAKHKADVEAATETCLLAGA